MKQEIKRVIDGNEYTFYQFPAMQGTKILMKLAKILGEPLGILGERIFKSGAKKILDSEASDVVSDLAISQIINSLMSKLDEEEAVAIIEALCQNVYFEGKALKEIFDSHFQGEYLRLAKVVKTALEVQYGNFFGGIAEILKSSPLVTTQAK